MLLKRVTFGSRTWKPGSPNATVKAVVRHDPAGATVAPQVKELTMPAAAAHHQLLVRQSAVHITRGTVHDAEGEPLVGNYSVQFQTDGNFIEMTVQASHAVCGGELVLTPTQHQRHGSPLVYDLTTPGTRIGQPRTQRKGRPYCLRVTLGRPDRRGPDKVVIDFVSSGQMERWRLCLTQLIHGEQYGYTLRRRQGVSGDIKDTVAEGRKARGGRADDDEDYEFGDWMRGVVAKGKQDRLNEARMSGAQAEGSRGGGGGSAVGDFARGLFK